MMIEISDGVWSHKTDAAWTQTATDDIRIDVHLNDGMTTMPLTMLIDLMYPIIRARMDAELSAELRATHIQAN